MNTDYISMDTADNGTSAPLVSSTASSAPSEVSPDISSKVSRASQFTSLAAAALLVAACGGSAKGSLNANTADGVKADGTAERNSGSSPAEESDRGEADDNSKESTQEAKCVFVWTQDGLLSVSDGDRVKVSRSTSAPLIVPVCSQSSLAVNGDTSFVQITSSYVGDNIQEAVQLNVQGLSLGIHPVQLNLGNRSFTIIFNVEQ